MDALFARYFDGDLNPREAVEFLEAIAADPRLEKELRKYERLLALGKSLPAPTAPAGFTGRVMARIFLERKAAPVRLPLDAGAVEEKRSFFRMPSPGFRWASVAVAAAVVALAFVGGFYSAGRRPAAPGAPADAVSPAFVNQAAADQGLRYVRLAYAPSDPSVQNVSVVGSFNNWDPKATPLSRQDGVWSTVLVLAPGSYEYMFLENGARFVTDPLAMQTRDDGFGGANAVLDVTF